MDTIVLEDFRCFGGRHEVSLRPLTFLVGENSSGKTSFLAGVKAAYDLLNPSRAPGFNNPGMPMGSFSEIRHNPSDSNEVKDEFSIGLKVSAIPNPFISEIKATFSGDANTDKPSISNLHVLFRGNSTVDFDRDSFVFNKGNPSLENQILIKENIFESPIMSVLFGLALGNKEGATRDGVLEFAKNIYQRYQSIYSFPPIRSEPLRTYTVNRKGEDWGQGELSVRFFESLRRPNGKKGLLFDFGNKSGLFQSLNIATLSADENLVQLRVNVNGSPSNIANVGYGVSQILPIVHQAIEGEKGATFLIQQPEVHLHPRAQAELGSLFATLAHKNSKTFLVETHSDYIIDRVRMEVRENNNIRCDDVLILFFENTKKGSIIHQIKIDKNADIIDPPENYREFFHREDMRFIGL